MEAPVLTAPSTGFVSYGVSLQTSRAREFIDLTSRVEEAIAHSGFENGIVVVSSQHTTASITVNEHEPELLKDLDLFLDNVAPEDKVYAHNAVPCLPGERPNGHAHCQALLLSASASIPLVNGRLSIGRWQRVFLVELDHARRRQVTISLLGV